MIGLRRLLEGLAGLAGTSSRSIPTCRLSGGLRGAIRTPCLDTEPPAGYTGGRQASTGSRSEPAFPAHFALGPVRPQIGNSGQHQAIGARLTIWSSCEPPDTRRVSTCRSTVLAPSAFDSPSSHRCVGVRRWPVGRLHHGCPNTSVRIRNRRDRRVACTSCCVPAVPGANLGARA